MSNSRPWPVRCPAAFSWVTSSSLLVAGPSRLTRSMAAAGERGEPGLPAGLQGAGDEPVFRLDGAERPLGPVGVVAGALDGEFGGPAGPLVPARDLAGGGQSQGNLAGGQRVQQRARDGGV